MQFGIALPHIGPEASQIALIEVAQSAERLGFHSLWVLDRLLWPLEPKSRYPGNPRGSLPAVMKTTYEPLTVLSFVSAHTRKLRLGTSVLVAGYRSPVLLAKMAATLDQLCGGRLILGLGAGWSADEFAAAGQTLSGRYGRIDEYIRALKTLWTEEMPAFEGNFYRVPKTIFLPKPVQQPHPPIWIGGNSNAAVRCAAQFGDGWHPTNRLNVSGVGQSIEFLRELARSAGRDPNRIALSLRWNAIADLAEPNNVKAMISQLRAYRDVGVQHVCFDLNIPTPRRLAAMKESMTRLAAEIIFKIDSRL